VVQFLLQGLGGIVAALLIAWFRVGAARRRRSKLERGDAVLVGVRLGLSAGKLRPGTLVLSPGRTIWTRRRGGATVDLAGAQILSSAMAPENYGANGFVRLRLRLPDGTRAQLQMHREDAATLAALLQSAPPAVATADPVVPPRRAGGLRRSWWAIACLVLGLGWAAANVIAALDGDTVQARVTGGDGEGYCTVTWPDADGAARRGEVACNDEPRGTQVGVRVFGWPDGGDPWNVGDAVLMVLVTSLPPVALGSGRLLYLRGRRRAWVSAHEPAHPDVMATDAAPPLPPLLDDDLRAALGETPAELAARLAPYARRQVPDDGWEQPKRPVGPPGPFALGRLGRALSGPVAALIVVAGITGPLVYQWLLLQRTPTATAVATSTGDVTADGLGPVPEQVTMRFRDDHGDTHLADVATTGSLPEGARATIEYAIQRPGWARLVGPTDGLGTGAAIGAGGATLALLWAGWALWSLGSSHRIIRLAGGQPPRPAVGLLTADGEGWPVVVAAEPLVIPPQFVLVPLLTPLPHGAAAAFASAPAPTLTVHGRLAEGEVVVIEVPGAAAPLLPSGNAELADSARLLDLLDSAGALARSLAADEDRVDQPVD
jgi:hypothetical protein